jgi:hypothetical protein
MRSGTKIYITHCSAKKADAYRESGEAVAPEKLYTATTILRFIARCSAETVPWAIFSDLYGIWFPEERHVWYEKAPSAVTDSEFSVLLADFDSKLREFDEVWFYYPGRIHRLHRELIRSSAQAGTVHLFSHLNEIHR